MPEPSTLPFEHLHRLHQMGFSHRHFWGGFADHALIFAGLGLVMMAIWILFALAAASVAAERGHRRLPWLAVGLALGPLALLGALIAPVLPVIATAEHARSLPPAEPPVMSPSADPPA